MRAAPQQNNPVEQPIGAHSLADDREGEELLQAATTGELNSLKKLLANGADPNHRDYNYGKTALMYAAEKGNIECMKELLANGANPNLQDKYGMTALMIAAEYGRAECLNELLENGADPNLHGGTALMLAAQNRRTETREVSIANGAGMNFMLANPTALMLAAGYGRNRKCLERLLAKVDPNVQDNNGWTALMFAALQGQDESLTVLLANGADVNVEAYEFGWTALSIARSSRVVGRWPQRILNCVQILEAAMLKTRPAGRR